MQKREVKMPIPILMFNQVHYGINIRIMRDSNNEEWINAFEFEHALEVRNGLHHKRVIH